MKRIKLMSIPLLLSVAMLASGCGSGNTGGGQVKQNKSIAVSGGEVADTIPREGAVAKPVSPVSVVLGEGYAEIVDLDSYNTTAEYRYFDLGLSGEDKGKFPKLQAAFEADAKEKADSLDSKIEFLISADELFRTEMPAGHAYVTEDLGWNMEASYDPFVMRADSNVVSLCARYYEYTGGTQGFDAVFGYNYDTKTGKLLSLSDVVMDEDRFYEIVDKKRQSEYEDIYDSLFPIDDYKEYLLDENIDFIVDNEGVIVILDPFDNSAYGQQQFIKVYFDEAQGIIYDEYREACDSYVIPWIPELDKTIDIGGKKLPLVLDYEYGDYDTGAYSGYTISLGDKSAYIDTYAFDIEKYIVKMKDKYFFLGIELVEGDSRLVRIVDLSAMKETGEEYFFGEMGIVNNYYDRDDTDPSYYIYNGMERKYAFTNPEKIPFSPSIQIPGNIRSGVVDYRLNPESGKLEQTGETWTD